jgi:hypothetical protein
MSTSLDIARPIFHGTKAVVEIRFPNRKKLLLEPGFLNDEDDFTDYLIGLAQEIKYKKQISVDEKSRIGMNGEPMFLIPQKVEYEGEIKKLAFDDANYPMYARFFGWIEDGITKNTGRFVHTFDIIIHHHYHINNGENSLVSNSVQLKDCVTTSIEREVRYNAYTIDKIKFKFRDVIIG